MVAESITLQVPQHIYERAQRIAASTKQSLEAVILHELETAFLPPLAEAEAAELDALTHLSDDALWTIARERVPAARQERLQNLMDGNTQGELSPAELRELEQLVELGQRLMLRKGKAAAILTARGYQVTREAL